MAEETSQAVGSTPAEPTGDAKTFSEKYVQELRSENAQRRVEAKELKDQFAALEAKTNERDAVFGKMAEALGVKPDPADQVDPMAAVMDLATSNQQKLVAAEARTQKVAIDSAIALAAQTEHAIAPKDIAKLIDRTNITYDAETLEVRGVQEAIAAMKAATPAYFGEPMNEDQKLRPPTGTPGGGTPRQTPVVPDDSFAGRLKKLSDARHPFGPPGTGANPEQIRREAR